ncbi:hypothetical protein C5471_03840 [Photorhabdus tasmaniensis]|uniref:Transposase Tn5-like N-terminal domain-containing protein n=1 Tax=Photorhabdus tasmaniensis TaxID=1004159 RepID=A0ABX0GEJ4_9GAMM|nr:hypothetical protein [Photorhabdus tasmaniensis]
MMFSVNTQGGAEETFKHAELGDKRRSKRLVQIAASLADLFARKPIGWAMSFSQDSGLTKKSLTMAWESRGKPPAKLLG